MCRHVWGWRRTGRHVGGEDLNAKNKEAQGVLVGGGAQRCLYSEPCPRAVTARRCAWLGSGNRNKKENNSVGAQSRRPQGTGHRGCSARGQQQRHTAHGRLLHSLLPRGALGEPFLGELFFGEAFLASFFFLSAAFFFLSLFFLSPLLPADFFLDLVADFSATAPCTPPATPPPAIVTCDSSFPKSSSSDTARVMWRRADLMLRRLPRHLVALPLLVDPLLVRRHLCRLPRQLQQLRRAVLNHGRQEHGGGRAHPPRVAPLLQRLPDARHRQLQLRHRRQRHRRRLLSALRGRCHCVGVKLARVSRLCVVLVRGLQRTQGIPHATVDEGRLPHSQVHGTQSKGGKGGTHSPRHGPGQSQHTTYKAHIRQPVLPAMPHTAREQVGTAFVLPVVSKQTNTNTQPQQASRRSSTQPHFLGDPFFLGDCFFLGELFFLFLAASSRLASAAW